MSLRLILVGIVAVIVAAPSIDGQIPAAREITFTKDLAPILLEHCVYCHRPGDIAPFSMLTFAEVRPWARSIKRQVLIKRMPPWFADPNHGDFINAKRLSDSEMETIVRWVDGGAKEGSPADMPTAPPSSGGWQIGSPDLIVNMTEPYRIPAT